MTDEATQSSLHPSLPRGVLNKKGDLIEANKRFLDLLELPKGSTSFLPIEKSKLEAAWPFFNQKKSKVALFDHILIQKTPKKEFVIAESQLKTFKLHVSRSAKGIEIVAQIMRSGDLLKDAPSRQVLFRSLEHEIRTSVLSLKGYLDMIEPKGSDQKMVSENMARTLKRLEKVVGRLTEFRELLGDDKE